VSNVGEKVVNLREEEGLSEEFWEYCKAQFWAG